MTRTAARKLARYLRSLGWSVRVRRHEAVSGLHYWTVTGGYPLGALAHPGSIHRRRRDRARPPGD
jgi:hypothetical protein